MTVIESKEFLKRYYDFNIKIKDISEIYTRDECNTEQIFEALRLILLYDRKYIYKYLPTDNIISKKELITKLKYSLITSITTDNYNLSEYLLNEIKNINIFTEFHLFMYYEDKYIPVIKFLLEEITLENVWKNKKLMENLINN